MVGRSAGFRRDSVSKAQALQVEGVDEGVDETDGVVLGDVVIQGLREQGWLVSVGSLDMIHRSLRVDKAGCLIYHI